MDSIDFPSTQPVIIGALGGSGTRAGVKLLRAAGIWMGDKVDPETEDSKAMSSYLNAWFNPIIEAASAGYGIHENAFRDLHRALSIHRENIPDAGTPWGWKNPRNMWLIPFYAQAFPGVKFIHMIRDVRDM
ncbi:MAG: sulfotransferase, partial [Alphaproteobacteria bacterium]|nr:sulfotransferase [Alphaproteobacteria bacterium]